MLKIYVYAYVYKSLSSKSLDSALFFKYIDKHRDIILVIDIQL